MKIKAFAVEEWMNKYEDGAKYNIAETCVDSVSLDELFALTGEDKEAFLADFCAKRLTYGDILGKPEFIEGICGLYKTLKPENIVSTHGAETGWNADGSLKSLWSWGKYRFDFLKEDGNWKIYRLEFHQCMNTPYEGKGWVEEPCYDLIGTAPAELRDNEPENCKPHRVTKKPYLPLSVDTPDCDLHNLNPAPPEPYATYDFEGIKDEDDLDWHI